MKRILVTSSGGAPAINFARSLKRYAEEFYLIGCDSNAYSLMRSETNERCLIPPVIDSGYIPSIKKIIKSRHIDFIHAQSDIEVGVISDKRDELGAVTFLPSKKSVRILRNKYESFKIWDESGIKVPKNILINSHADLKKAYEKFGNDIWIREICGAAGKGSLASPSFDLAKEWIESRKGWGNFAAAERLTNETVTWMSLYKNGELITAQCRKRINWLFSDRAQSGVTGITGVGLTVSDSQVDEIAQKSIFAADPKPNGIFSVDMTYDKHGVPNPTEINVGKFFTTHYFFSKAGLNMPYIYIKAAFGEPIPKLKKKINPLKDGLLWIRGMDIEPILSSVEEIELLKNESIQLCGAKYGKK